MNYSSKNILKGGPIDLTYNGGVDQDLSDEFTIPYELAANGLRIDLIVTNRNPGGCTVALMWKASPDSALDWAQFDSSDGVAVLTGGGPGSTQPEIDVIVLSPTQTGKTYTFPMPSGIYKLVSTAQEADCAVTIEQIRLYLPG